MLENRKKAMGLDVGEARVGVALSDSLKITAQPHSTLEGSKSKIISLIKEIIEKEFVDTIAIGLPLELSGKEGEQAQKVRKFVDEMRVGLPPSISIVFWDERLTTEQAKRVTQGSKLKNKDASRALDKISASIILDSYLQSTTVHSN